MRLLAILYIVLQTCSLLSQKSIIISNEIGKPLEKLVLRSSEFEDKVVTGKLEVHFSKEESFGEWVASSDGYTNERFIPQSVDTLILYLTTTLQDFIVSDFSSTRPSYYGGFDQQINPLEITMQGTAHQLKKMNGVFVDASLGEIASRVYTRGLSVNAEDDIGWYYVSLQEDGLPISAVQYNYFAPDFFHRTDLADTKIEFIRGGKAGILGPNSPGGIINYLSKDNILKSGFTIKSTVGLEGENGYGRLDGLWQEKLNPSTSLMWSGHYRYAEGHRQTPYAWSNGGQLKARLRHKFDQGVIRFGVKYLNDRTNRYTGMTATNWDDPEAAFGQSFSSTALMMPQVKLDIPGGPDFVDGIGSYEYDSSRGIHMTELAFQLGLDYQLGDWDLDVSAKYAKKTIDWQTSFSNARMQLDDPTPYFISGASFPLGSVSFQDAVTKMPVAVVNNSEIFSGGGYSYTSGSLPNDALMGIAPWKKDDALDDLMIQIIGMRKFGSGTLSLGTFLSQSELDYFTNASAAYVTFEPSPRLLEVSIQDFSGNTLKLSDTDGISNYGGLFFENGEVAAIQSSLFAHYNQQIGDRLEVELGGRYEYINHTGNQVIPISYDGSEGGLDSDVSTVYDRSILVPSDQSNDYDFSYHNRSFSLAAAYLAEGQELFARASIAQKAPELNYYITYQSQLEKGISEDILQLELGYKYQRSRLEAEVIAFYSRQSNVAKSDFGQDEMTQQIFRLPIQLIDARTIGLEFDWSAELNSKWKLIGQHTIQQSKSIDYTVVNSNETMMIEDDILIDFSKKELPHVPQAMHRLGIEGSYERFRADLSVFHMGSRYGNIENSFQMKAYQTIDLSLAYSLTSKCEVSLNGQNIFNSTGIANFFGPNTFGANANNATSEYISANPEADFVVFPILPRSIYFSIRYEI